MKSTSPGFTIIELLVVMGVLVTITALLISNYNNFNAIEKLRQAGKTLKTDLRIAQTDATSGLKPTGCGTLDGYQVTFTSSSYALQAVCGGVATGPVSTITLSDQVTIPSPPAQPIFFRVLSGTIAAPLTITLSASSKTYQLQLNTGGDINDLGMQ